MPEDDDLPPIQAPEDADPEPEAEHAPPPEVQEAEDDA